MNKENYYREKPLRDIDTHSTMYHTVKTQNQNNLNYDALGYMGDSISYKKLLKRVEALAASFCEAGIKEGDVVPVCTINTPEVAEVLLALNKLGACSKWIDLRSTDEQLIKYINEDDSKLFIGFDVLMPRMEKILKETNLEKVLSVSPTDSINPLRVLVKSPKDFVNLLKEGKKQKEEGKIIIPDDKRIVLYKDFIKLKNYTLSKEVPFDKERPTLIVQSSGTTGLAKSIVHTDFSVNSSVYSISHSQLPFEAGNSLLTIVPPWISYGLINSLYLSLALGMEAYLAPQVDGDTVYNNLGKFNLAMATPLHYRYIAERIDSVNKKDLDKIVYLITGGDKIDANEQRKLEEILHHPIFNGYGCNEVLGGVTTTPIDKNKPGTVGIPLYNIDIAAFDSDTNEKLPANTTGEICVATDTLFKEYKNNKKATDEAKMKYEGKDWLKTGDLGYVDEEGYVHVEGRLRRVIIRKAFKIFPGTIEEVILTHPAVKDCVTVGVKDKEDGYSPMAHIALKDEFVGFENEILEQVKEKCEKELKDYEQPKYYNVVDNIPYTPNNKQDFKALEKLSEEIVNGCESKKLVLK